MGYLGYVESMLEYLHIENCYKFIRNLRLVIIIDDENEKL